MYHIYKNNKIIASSSIWFSWKIDWEVIFKNFTEEELLKINSWYSFDNEKWIFSETEESKIFQLNWLKKDLEKITNDLVNINWKIEWAKKLREMLILDQDDELELVWYEAEAQKLIIARGEIKTKIKELWN